MIIIVRSGGIIVCSIGRLGICDCDGGGGGGGGRWVRGIKRSVSASILWFDAIRDTSMDDILVIRKLLCSNLSDCTFNLS
jgi:hypothetical protein